jgi:hypothetical protein
MSTSFPARFLALAVTTALISACAPAPGSAPSTDVPAPRSSNSDIITRAELADPMLAGSTLLEAVRRLRPRFLNVRGASFDGTLEAVKISYDGSELLPVSELSRMEVTEVTEIRYLNTAAAAQRFGMAGSNGPVLLLTMRAR